MINRKLKMAFVVASPLKREFIPFFREARGVFFIPLFFMLSLPQAFAQDIDSLKLALKNAKHDTTRCNILNELAETASDDEWPVFNEQLKVLAEKNIAKKTSLKKIYLKHLADALNNIGFLALQQGDIPKALEYYHKSLQLRKDIKDKKGIAMSLNNIGFIYYNQGDIPKALEYFHKSLQLQEEIKDKYGIANSLNNIGRIYNKQGDTNKALEYWHKSLKLREDIKDKRGIAESLNNIGGIYRNQGDIPKALEYYQKSLHLQEDIKDKKGIASSLNNIGYIYGHQGDPSITASKEASLRAGKTKALEYYHKSLQLQEEIKNKQGIATSLNNIADAMLQMDMLAGAFDYAKRSLQTAKELGYPEIIKNAAWTLKNIYKKQNKYKEAMAMYELEIQMRDSIANEANKKASIQKQFQYEYEKKAAADSVANVKANEIKNAQIAQQHAELKAKRNQQYGLYGGLVLVLAFAGFMYNRFKVTQKQKVVIEQQKAVVEKAHTLLEEKNNEIIASIRYAKRIQDALLTSQKYIERNINRLKN